MTYEKLNKLLDYNEHTGEFVWKVSKRPGYKGKVAGTKHHRGYLQISIDGVAYASHRLAWLYIYKTFPENMIDHINRNPLDNRIKNLREVTNQCNQRNTGNWKSNTSGVKGVTFNKHAGKWRSNIVTKGKLVYLGYFDDFTEAVAHRLAAEQCLSWSNCDSDSPANIYINTYLKESYNGKA